MNLNKNLICLKWDDFDNFVVNGLSNLYQKDDMSDITLFCDGRSFKAHKIVLSIWSSYFREIFASTTHSNPVIVLRETKSSDLELILRFIYQGQLFVPFEDTERFLKTAEYFHIAGLLSYRRDMRVHLSTSERNTAPEGGENLSGGGSIAKSGSSSSIVGTHGPTPTIVGVHSSAMMTSTNGNNSLPLISQTFPNPSFTGHSHTTSMASIDGIPVQILGPSSSSGSPTHTNHNVSGHNSSSVNPISIITNNPGGPPPSQFSTNVIKPIPSRQPNRLHQSPLLSPNSSTNPNSSYGHNLPNAGNRSGQELMYGTQPILVVHNQHQKQISEYHEIDNSNGIMESNRQAEQVIVFERVSSGANERKISSMDHHPSLGSGLAQHDSIMTNHNVHNHMQDEAEEVLGLSYMHENSSSRNSSNHSHIIREAAVAAGVVGTASSESTEIIEMNRDSSFTSSTDSTTTSGKSAKITNSVVLIPSTSTPVYAVKRVPSHTSSSIGSSLPKASCSKPKATTSNSNSSKVFKSKVKRQRKPSSQNSEVEFVNCPKCDKRVKKTSLKVHIKRTHLEEGTVLICPICGKQISSKGVYYKHMYGHRQKSTDIRPHLTTKPKEESRTQ